MLIMDMPQCWCYLELVDMLLWLCFLFHDDTVAIPNSPVMKQSIYSTNRTIMLGSSAPFRYLPSKH